MEREAIAHLLGGCAVLGGLDLDDRIELAGLARLVRQPAGAVIFFQGDEADALYVVRRGAVRIVHQVSDGRELLLNLLTSGTAFGEIALLDGAPRTASAIVERDAELVRIPRRPFLERVRSRPQLALAVIGVLCGRIRATTDRAEEGLFLSARARVARHLLRLVALHGRHERDRIAIAQRLPQSELAGACGLSRQTVNQVLGELREEGVVEVRRARVAVRDLDALERSARP